jgi:hypothetical protein
MGAAEGAGSAADWALIVVVAGGEGAGCLGGGCLAGVVVTTLMTDGLRGGWGRVLVTRDVEGGGRLAGLGMLLWRDLGGGVPLRGLRAGGSGGLGGRREPGGRWGLGGLRCVPAIWPAGGLRGGGRVLLVLSVLPVGGGWQLTFDAPGKLVAQMVVQLASRICRTQRAAGSINYAQS